MKSKLFGLIFIVFCIFSVNASFGKYSGGTGEPNTPYLISDANDMNEIGTHTGDWGSHFLLVNDINMASYEYTTALIAPDTDNAAASFQGTFFTGVFDGNNHSISNFTCQAADSDNIGLFGYIDDMNSVIRDLILIDPNIHGNQYVGSLVGFLNNGTVTNCNIYYGADISGNSSVGGLVGFNFGTILNCYAAGTVDGNTAIGGLVGSNKSTILNCYAIGNVSGNNWGTGGLVGYNAWDSKISNCYTTGTVDGNTAIGGLVGLMADSYIFDCYATGNVNGKDATGGLVGAMQEDFGVSSQLENCYATGNVSGNNRDTGGLVGYVSGSDISGCYATGNVDGNDSTGGLVGYMQKPIEGPSSWLKNSYATGTVSVSGYYSVGGLVGYNENSMITNCYSAVEILGDIYWVDTLEINRADMGGSSQENLVSGLGAPSGIALDTAAGKMYWTDDGTNKIQRANLDGSGVENLVISGLTTPTGIALDISAGKMYWTDAGTDKIQRANLDGTVVEDLIVSGVAGLGSIAVDSSAGKMYWTRNARRENMLQRANLDGTGIEDLVTSGVSFYPYSGLALDSSAGKIYWTDAGTNNIQRANLDGSGVESLVTSGLSDPHSIALDISAGKMYWTDDGTKKIQRANFDGSGVKDIITSGLSNLRGIALVGVTSGGGLVGYDNGGSYTACFWDSDINPDVNGIGNGSDPNVIGESTANMQVGSTYISAGWDFVGETVNGNDDIWRLCASGVYPRLIWQFYNYGDLSCPDGVDFIDYSVLASQWSLTKLTADVTGDGIVNFSDWALLTQNELDMNTLADFSQHWLQYSARNGDIAPVGGDGVVNRLDLIRFCENWLEGK